MGTSIEKYVNMENLTDNGENKQIVFVDMENQLLFHLQLGDLYPDDSVNLTIFNGWDQRLFIFNVKSIIKKCVSHAKGGELITESTVKGIGEDKMFDIFIMQIQAVTLNMILISKNLKSACIRVAN